LILRPPDSLLFPYTTLFRSRIRDASPQVLKPTIPNAVRVQVSVGLLELLAPINVRIGQDFERARGSAPDFIRIRNVVRKRPERRDRKSTRLNSSHEWISYAV